mgnify:CR=1 FL=1
MVKGYGIGKRTGQGLLKPGRYEVALRFSPRGARGLACTLDTDAVSLTHDGRGHTRGGAVGRPPVGGVVASVGWRLACPGGKPKRGGGWPSQSNSVEKDTPMDFGEVIGADGRTDGHVINPYS